MVTSWNLSNKAKLVIEEIPYLKSAAIGVYIKLGSRHESEPLAGGSHFIEHMLFKGTGRRTAREIAENFEGIGGQLNAYTSKEYTCVYARTLDENLDDAMDIIFDMLLNSQFNERDFATEKEVVIEEINMYEDTPDDLIHDVFSRKLWQGHAMGEPILGTLDSVANFNRGQIYDFYKYCYTPANMVIAVAGSVDKAKIKDRLEEYLKDQPTHQVELPRLQPPNNTRFVDLVSKDTEQIQICIGVPGVSYHDEERYTQNIMNSILGGGLSSRLFQSLREERGLAYSIYSSPSNYSDTGSYSIHLGTGPAKINQVFAALWQELDRFYNEGVNEIEVARTRKLLKASAYLGLESVMNRMSRLGKAVMMYDKVMPIEEIIDKVMAIDTGKINKFIKNTLSPQQVSLAAIGTFEALVEVEAEYRRWWK